MADQVPVSGGSQSEHSGSGRPNPILGLDNKSGKIRNKTYSRLKLQDLILRLKSKHVLTARCLMSLIGLLASTEKMVPEGHLHMRPFQFHLKEHWRYPQSYPSLVRSHFSTPRRVAKSLKRDERCRPSSQRPQYPTFYRCLKRRLGHLLRSKLYKGSVVRPGKKATHKRSKIEGGLPSPSKLQGPVPEPNSVCCNGQLNSGSLHKQRGTHSTEICALLWKIMTSHNIESETHSRVPECDGQPSVQVEPSAVNRMVTASAGVQTDLPKVVHTSCRPICHSSEPQTSTVHISCPRPKGLEHRCSEHKLDRSHCYAYPPTALLHRVIQKIRQCYCLIIVIAPGWPGCPGFGT